MPEPREVSIARVSLTTVKGVTGIGYDGKNIIVYVVDESVKPSIPMTLAGKPVIVKVSGPIGPLK